MGKRGTTQRRRAAQPPVPAGQVPVVIRAGHRHRGVLYEVDTATFVTEKERELLARFGGIVGES